MEDVVVNFSITGARPGDRRLGLVCRGWPRWRWTGVSVRIGCYIVWLEAGS